MGLVALAVVIGSREGFAERKHTGVVVGVDGHSNAAVVAKIFNKQF